LALPRSSARGQKGHPSPRATPSSPRRSSQPELRPIREILRELL
jgi:hypothetical protein